MQVLKQLVDIVSSIFSGALDKWKQLTIHTVSPFPQLEIASTHTHCARRAVPSSSFNSGTGVINGKSVSQTDSAGEVSSGVRLHEGMVSVGIARALGWHSMHVL